MWLMTHPLFSFVQNFRMQAPHTLNRRTPAKDLHRFWGVKKYKQGVAFPYEGDTQNQKIIPEKTNITPPLSNKNLIFAPGFLQSVS